MTTSPQSSQTHAGVEGLSQAAPPRLASQISRDDLYRDTIRYLFQPVADLLYEDHTVTEVMIQGPNVIYCERRGRVERVDRQFRDERSLMAAVNNIAEFVDRRIDETRPTMDARLPAPHRFRVNVILPPISRSGVCVTIRKFSESQWTIDDLIRVESLSPVAAAYLNVMIKTHHNIIVSGGTGSGKTSLLNALSGMIPSHERVIVIEDAAELRLAHENVIYLEARPAAGELLPAITIRDLFVNSLRMRPDRIVVGEVRRGEALDLVQSMLSGHDGALSTIHASTPIGALARLETLSLMTEESLPVYVARSQIASAIHAIVQVRRMPDGTRRVSRIAEVLGLKTQGPPGSERYRVRTVFDLAGYDWDGEGRSRTELAWTGRTSRFSQEIRGARTVLRKNWNLALDPVVEIFGLA